MFRQGHVLQEGRQLEKDEHNKDEHKWVVRERLTGEKQAHND